MYVEEALRKYERALNSYDSGLIEQAKKELKKFIKEIED